MRKLISTLIGMCLILAPALAAGGAGHRQAGMPQETAQEKPEKPESSRSINVVEGELQVLTYRPRWTHAPALADGIMRTLGRRFMVKARDGLSGPHMSIFAIGDVVGIYDTADRAKRILSALKQVDEAAMPPRTKALKIQPRHVSVRDLERFLKVWLNRRRDQGVRPRVETISAVGTLVVKASPETLREIQGVVRDLDRPPVQMMLTFWIVRASSTRPETTRPAPPEDLVVDLARLVSASAFELLGTGMIRLEVTAGENAEWARLNMSLANQGITEIKLEPGRFDPASGKLTLHSIQCQVSTGKSNQSLQTAVTISPDRYVALGAMGEKPIFIVIKSKVLSR